LHSKMAGSAVLVGVRTICTTPGPIVLGAAAARWLMARPRILDVRLGPGQRRLAAPAPSSCSPEAAARFIPETKRPPRSPEAARIVIATVVAVD
jgi:hypothetical protein